MAAETTIDLSELEELIKDITQYPEDVQNNVFKSLVAGGHLIRNEAIKSIDAQMSKGISYKRGQVIHIASLRGFPPNKNIGDLSAKSLFVEEIAGKNVQVGALESIAPYAKYLEDPTKLNRPFLSRALKLKTSKIQQLINQAIQGTT